MQFVGCFGTGCELFFAVALGLLSRCGCASFGLVWVVWGNAPNRLKVSLEPSQQHPGYQPQTNPRPALKLNTRPKPALSNSELSPHQSQWAALVRAKPVMLGMRPVNTQP